jgi:GRAM domain
MKTELRQGEQIVKEGSANLQKNIETVGGKLYLTNRRLVFEAHQINVQGGTTEVELSNIQSSQTCWTKFLGLIPLFPNSLAVYTKQGRAYRFVLFDRAAWAAAIEAHRNG